MYAETKYGYTDVARWAVAGSGEWPVAPRRKKSGGIRMGVERPTLRFWDCVVE